MGLGILLSFTHILSHIFPYTQSLTVRIIACYVSRYPPSTFGAPYHPHFFAIRCPIILDDLWRTIAIPCRTGHDLFNGHHFLFQIVLLFCLKFCPFLIRYFFRHHPTFLL